ncbi:MAG: right-handed parallel beta-helix repeat-containing protein [Halioglobus sp.]
MKRLKMDYVSTLLAAALLVTATSAQAAVHRVYEGESIQAAIDAASSGDTILVEPGIYQADPASTYGLRITKDNLRLIGKVKKGQGEAGKVRLVYQADDDGDDTNGQKTGVYAAPADCDYKLSTKDCEEILGSGFEYLKGFYIRGFSVEGFPVNGIQTRWVDGFEFVRNESANNLNNGIYPTLSANGLVRNNESYGSLDTAMWVAGSENVRVIGNELHSSVIGFEITVSNDVQVTQNDIYNNTVGVGLFHPNGAGNPPLPVMANWVIEHNDVSSNNGIDVNGNPIVAPPGSFQADLPPGAGILLLGVSDASLSKNNVEDNDYVGIGVLGWCTATNGTANSCDLKPPVDPEFGFQNPAANNNLVAQNYLSGNGGKPPVGAPFPPADLLYLQFEPGAAGNCFKKNKPKNSVTFYAAYPPSALPPEGGPLPTDGC